MATQKQIEANRRNAQRSTGPKTPEGKAAVSRNAQKHGLASRLVVLPEENRTRFLELLAGFRSELRPATAFEESLVFQLAAAGWRLRRIVRFETGLLTDRLHALREDLEIDPSVPGADESHADRQYHQDTRLLAQAFCCDAEPDTFLKLLRYENSARRAFYKALHQLSLVQSRRAPTLSADSAAASVLSRKFIDNRGRCSRQAEGLSHEAALFTHLRDRTLAGRSPEH
jgi:hypothetical protein